MPSQSRLSCKGRFRPLPLFRYDRFGSVTEPSLDCRGVWRAAGRTATARRWRNSF
jgi:hypothetical protein